MIYQLQDLLITSAGRHGDRIAVQLGNQRITYRDLDRRSSQLAATLRDRGVQPGARVGIFMKKSIDSVAGIFGILKAGGVYVPIDPAAPAKRAAYIIADCGIRHLVTTRANLECLEPHFDGAATPPLTAAIVEAAPGAAIESPMCASVVDWDDVERAEPLQPIHRGVDHDLAYLLYTSGSTGAPKGVMISHRAALTFINWTFECFEMSCEDVVSSHAPFHFDLSIFDLFTSIKAGAAMALVPEGLSTFPIRLTEFIRDNKITAWYSVPSALVLMLTRGQFTEQSLPDLRLILFAGEVFPAKYLRQLRHATTARLYNLYGPTETNVCTYYEVQALDDDRTAPIPIGRATANYEVFAVTDKNELAKPGEMGELYARGPGLMSGYWGDQRKTRSVLIRNPFQRNFDDIVCKTGDLVTRTDDGDYLYVGRRDHMVKVRGNRVELGEVESVLHQHDHISEAVVVPVPDEAMTNRLKAVVACDGEMTLTARQVREHCLRHLPRYMVPEFVEFAPSLPKTSTGKVDRRALAV